MIVRKMSKPTSRSCRSVLVAACAGLQAAGLPSAVFAAAGQTLVPPAPEFSWWGYLQAILVMVVVLAALWAVVWALRRSGRFAGMPRGTLPKGSLFVEGQLALAPRKGVVVVRFLNKRLLLGVTEQQISLLTETDLDDEQPAFAKCLEQADKNDTV